MQDRRDKTDRIRKVRLAGWRFVRFVPIVLKFGRPNIGEEMSSLFSRFEADSVHLPIDCENLTEE